MSPDRRPGSTRDRILDVALDVLAEHGFRGTTITEVERRAGLTPGTGSFYRHFRSKEELLEAAVNQEVDRCMAESVAVRAAIAADDGAPSPSQWLGLLLDDIRRFDRLLRLQLTEGDRVPELRAAITSALQGPGAKLSWEKDSALLVQLAALTGLHVLQTTGSPMFADVPEADFLRTLASSLEEPVHKGAG